MASRLISVNLINDNNSLVWVNKLKGLDWLSSAQSNAQAITKEALDSAPKIVKDFEGPPLDGRKIDQKGKALRFIKALPNHPGTTITNEEPDLPQRK